MSTPAAECDLKCEENLRKILRKLKNKFREHYILLQAAMNEQKILLDYLWVLCQRFLILTRGAICAQPYPCAETSREEREIREMFKTKKIPLLQSNAKLASSLCSVKYMTLAFDKALAKINASLPNSIIEGYGNRKPIFYYIELFSDLYKTFHEVQKQLNLLAQTLMVDDMLSILDYQELLKKRGGFNEYIEESLQVNSELCY